MSKGRSAYHCISIYKKHYYDLGIEYTFEIFGW